MTPLLGPDLNWYCSVECLRNSLGVIASPVRMALPSEYDEPCYGCTVYDNPED